MALPTTDAGPAGDLDHDPVEITVVVVSYHCRDHVLACVDSLARARCRRRLEVIVVDNGSTDGTLEALAARPDPVQVVAMGTNAGFSRANNIGMARAAGRHVLILNPDTRVDDDALDRLADWLDAHPEAGMAAPRLVNPDGSDQRTARSFPTPAAAVFGRRSPLTRWFPANPWSSRFLSGRDHRGDEPFEVDWVSGAAMMVPATVVARTGGFDETFFLFWEDADWCRRLADDGYQVWCVPEARIAHDEGGTRDHGWSPRVAAHFHRGAYLYWRNHHAPQAWNPARWAAAGLLATRAAAVVALDALRQIRTHDHVPPHDQAHDHNLSSPHPLRSRSTAPIPEPTR